MEFKIKSENLIPFDKSGIKEKVLKIAIAPDKSNVIYAVSSEGVLFVSHNYGKSFDKASDTGIIPEPDAVAPGCKIIASKNGVAYVFVRNARKSVIGIGKDYGNIWEFKTLDFPVSDIFITGKPYILYFSNRLRYDLSIKNYEYLGGYDFAKHKFIRVLNPNPETFFLWDEPVFPARPYGNKIFFSFNDDTGRLASENFEQDSNGNLKLSNISKEINPFEFHLLSEIKDFCKLSDDMLLIATSNGISLSDLKTGNSIPANDIILPSGKRLSNTKNVFLIPVKLIPDKSHNLVFMLTKYGGVFAGKFVGKKFYWFNLTSYAISGADFANTNISNKENHPLKDRFIFMSFPYYGFPDHQPTICYDFDISQNSFVIVIATSKGLVKEYLTINKEGKQSGEKGQK